MLTSRNEPYSIAILNSLYFMSGKSSGFIATLESIRYGVKNKLKGVYK